MNVTHSDEEVMAALRKAVELKGEDYTYPDNEMADGTCRYATAESTPSCIVGHVVHILDPEAFAQLARVEGEHGTDAASSLAWRPIDGGEGYLAPGFWSDRAAGFLQAAQNMQDGGFTWGDALAHAEDYR